jgi:hypothetical protein
VKPGHRKRLAVSAFCSARFALTKTKMRGALRGRPTAPPRLPAKHDRRHNDGGQAMKTLPLPFLADEEGETQRRWATLAIKRFWPVDFADGFRCDLGGRLHGQRDCDGFPGGFHAWPLTRRETWLAGFAHGFHYRLRCTAERDRGDGGGP